MREITLLHGVCQDFRCETGLGRFYTPQDIEATTAT
jgi:hypothetical protein